MSLRYNLLIVSDAVDTASLWKPMMSEVNVAANVVELSADRAFTSDEAYDLVVLDIYSAAADVLEWVRHIRAEAAVPILLLTPASSEAYLLGAYNAGVTDCIVKPVSAALLLAKVRALLHMTQNTILDTPDLLQVGDLSLNLNQCIVIFANGKQIKLSRLECRLLAILLRHAGQTLETNTLIERVWGYDDSDPTVLKNVIYRLRRKIEPDPKQPQYLLWMGEGYAFFPQSQDL